MRIGFFRWLTERSFVHGEPTVDRTRKELIVPVYFGTSIVAAVWLPVLVTKERGHLHTLGAVLKIAAVAALLVDLLSVSLYVAATRRVSRGLCEAAVVAGCAAVVVLDLGGGFAGDSHTVAGYVVLGLDCLLLCGCRDSVSRAVVCAGVAAIAVRSAVAAEYSECDDAPQRMSAEHLYKILSPTVTQSVVLTVDFIFTRGFARSTNEQRALVEASIRVSEQAAVNLSKYETEHTEALLQGPEGERLPPGIRAALLQLVANLARYRPYLPQHCLQADSTPSSSADLPVVVDSASTWSEGRAAPLPRSALDCSADQDVGRSFAVQVETDARVKTVSLVAANAKSFLSYVNDQPDISEISSFLQAEVGVFVGEVLSGLGIVDAVSGDHMSAHFNASRMCTSHRLNAAHVAWAVAGDGSDDGVGRTCSVCTGSVLCGDFGTSHVRRFMLLGGTCNALHSLERVAARLGAVLVDEAVGADGGVGTDFFCVLVERVRFVKRGSRPFLVWQIAGRRSPNGPADEWMYELAAREDPHAAWNEKIERWLHFGPALTHDDLDGAPAAIHSGSVTSERQQTSLVEASFAGGTVAVITCADVGVPAAHVGW